MWWLVVVLAVLLRRVDDDRELASSVYMTQLIVYDIHIHSFPC